MNGATLSQRERKRLADLVEALITNCHQAERAASSDTSWHELMEALDDVAVLVLRRRVMAGDLAAVAQVLVSPMSRAACAMAFVAAVEPYLDADQVAEIRQLWAQPAVDKVAHYNRMLTLQKPTA